jgi:hypothetical protein
MPVQPKQRSGKTSSRDSVRAALGSIAPPNVDDSLIAFVHIPKTAGGTLVNMLATAYSRQAVHDAGNIFRGPERTVRKVSRRPGGWERWQRGGGRVTAGHVPYGVFREHTPQATRYITLLREPVARVLSHYHSHLRPTGTSADARKRAMGVHLTDSIEEALELRPPELTNLATRFLSGHSSPRGELPARALSDAKDNLGSFAFVGLQERFVESVVLLQRTLGLGPVPYLSRHVTSDRRDVGEVPDEQRALIVANNALDAELFELGQELLEEAVAAAGDGFDAHVELLRALSAETEGQALDDARRLFDRHLPPGSSEPRATVFELADAAGVPRAAVKRVAAQLSVQRERGGDGQVIWARDGPPRAT